MIRTPHSYFRGPGFNPWSKKINNVSFNLNPSLKALTPNIVTLKVSTSSYEFGEDTIQSITGEIEDYLQHFLKIFSFTKVKVY